MFLPTLAFLNEDLAYAAALDDDLLVLVQAGGEPVQVWLSGTAEE